MKTVYLIEVIVFNTIDTKFKSKYFRHDLYDTKEEASAAIPKIAEETKGFYKEAKNTDAMNYLFRVEEWNHSIENVNSNGDTVLKIE